MATVPVGMRLSTEMWARHSVAAQVLGVPLSVYLRQRLEEQDRTAATLAEIRSSLAHAAAGAEASGEAAISPSLLVEVVLLLRQLAGPQRVGLAGCATPSRSRHGGRPRRRSRTSGRSARSATTTKT